ncbi:DNA polymerase III subunit delta' [Chitinimonas lacunae]|uniref:DNA polymerase III subunit delta' n=1 Tax=Chitinimonas lacunae TaxID=1963018 RepID=A0ABV8MJ47_9NEIS
MLYPWHQAAWHELRQQTARLPHALLLCGEAGIGKLAFGRHLAQSLLCENEAATAPCGHCDGCRWFELGNHPDYRELAPLGSDSDEEEGTKKKPSTQITIDQVRELNDFVNLSAHRGGRRVTLIQPADALNLAAANALLKTLEEPPEGAIFILVSQQWRRLLPTLRSRCRRLPLPLPSRGPALEWLSSQGLSEAERHLDEAGGAPLLALERAEAGLAQQRRELLDQLADPRRLDVLKLAEKLDRQHVEVVQAVDWLLRWIHDLVRLRLSGSTRYFPAETARLAALADAADVQRLMRYHDDVLEARRLALHPLNPRLVFEQLLFGYQQALRGGRS